MNTYICSLYITVYNECAAYLAICSVAGWHTRPMNLAIVSFVSSFLALLLLMLLLLLQKYPEK